MALRMEMEVRLGHNRKLFFTKQQNNYNSENVSEITRDNNDIHVNAIKNVL